MLSINTNISSYIAQRSLNNSTQLLNQAIERMTTGYKLNHASDNAANYSISTNQTTKLSAYQVAEDNASMGLDLLTTANDSLNLISDHLTRIRDLAVQAGNGTYGEQSLKAINAEVNARIDEIERLYDTTEYSGKKLYREDSNNVSFIEEVIKRDTSTMNKLSAVDETQALTSGVYSISTAEELAKLATMTNNDLIGENTEFVLANDIDLSAYSTGEGWTPIGESYGFKGVFDGNGYTIKNLYINVKDSSGGYFGLFGRMNSYTAIIKNIGLINVELNVQRRKTGLSRATFVGALVGGAPGKIINCYSTGKVSSEFMYTGGLVGNAEGEITNSFSSCIVDGINYVGGLAGQANSINNSYATGDVVGNETVGGLAGWATSINNSYSTGDVTGSQWIGALVGKEQFIINAGLVGDGSWTPDPNNFNSTTIKNSYASGTVIENGVEVDTFIPMINDGDDIDANSRKLAPGEAIPAGVGATTGASSSSNNNVTLFFQVGINGSESSQIELNMGFALNNISNLRTIGLSNGDYLSIIDNILSTISSKQVEYGACQNRLESALDEISTHYENLVSSRSTLRDADIAKVSSEYIRQQILQQASATLMATANQSPSIALQLL